MQVIKCLTEDHARPGIVFSVKFLCEPLSAYEDLSTQDRQVVWRLLLFHPQMLLFLFYYLDSSVVSILLDEQIPGSFPEE